MLDPEIQPIVDLMNANPDPPGYFAPVEQARATHDLETAEMSGPGPQVAEVRDLEAPGPGGPIPVRVFRPEGAGPLALVAYLHGGGWVIGSLDGFDPLCRALANESGAVVASIGYRLAPEHPFPAAPDDARAALRWLHEHAAELGADPGRMGVAGDSAGANLATVAARRLRDEGDSPLRFQALVYPVCDSALNTPSYRESSEGFGLSAAGMKRFWDLYLNGADGRRPDASPLQAEDLSGLPPAFVLTVRDDVLRDEGEAYAAALEAAGVPVTLRRYDGAIHGFFRWIARTEISRRAVAEVGAALRAALAVGTGRAPGQ
jgi:acetyl esterase